MKIRIRLEWKWKENEKKMKRKWKENEYKSKIKRSMWLRKKWSMGWAGIIWKMINNKQSEKSEKYRNTTWWRLKKNSIDQKYY